MPTEYGILKPLDIPINPEHWFGNYYFLPSRFKRLASSAKGTISSEHAEKVAASWFHLLLQAFSMPNMACDACAGFRRKVQTLR